MRTLVLERSYVGISMHTYAHTYIHTHDIQHTHTQTQSTQKWGIQVIYVPESSGSFFGVITMDIRTKR